MSLFNEWRDLAYAEQDAEAQKKFWTQYFEVEQSIYEKLLDNPKEVVSGTVIELAEGYGIDKLRFVGFLDGINDSLVTPNALEEVEETSQIQLNIDLEKLYYNMQAAKAHWLYELPQWDSLLTLEKKKEITKAQRKSGTIVKEKEVGRNESCPCGSGKKYKKCCGASV